MKWSNLKSMRCPQCGEGLCRTCVAGSGYACGSVDCRFFILARTLNSVVASLYSRERRSPGAQDEERNLSELNNLGAEEVAEDFSDSSALNY